MCASIIQLVAIGSLSACGPNQPVPEPSTEPTSYHIESADLAAAEPGDICRSRDAAFLRNLLLRVTAILPAGTSAFEFVSFDVEDDSEGDGKLATVRFLATLPGGKPQEMYATGAFETPGCAVGPLVSGVGSGGPVDRQTATFREMEHSSG